MEDGLQQMQRGGALLRARPQGAGEEPARAPPGPAHSRGAVFRERRFNELLLTR